MAFNYAQAAVEGSKEMLNQADSYLAVKQQNKQIKVAGEEAVRNLAGSYIARAQQRYEQEAAINDAETEIKLRALRERSAMTASAAGSGVYGNQVKRALIASGARRGVDIGKAEDQREAVKTSEILSNQADYRNTQAKLRSIKSQGSGFNLGMAILKVAMATISGGTSGSLNATGGAAAG